MLRVGSGPVGKRVICFLEYGVYLMRGRDLVLFCFCFVLGFLWVVVTVGTLGWFLAYIFSYFFIFHIPFGAPFLLTIYVTSCP